MGKLRYLLLSPGRFHYFEVARILYSRNQLIKIISGYPWFKLKKQNIPNDYVEHFGLFQVLTNLILRTQLFYGKKFVDYLIKLNCKKVDQLACKYIDQADVLLSMSGVGLKSGKKMIANNKIYICERTSAHILFQQKILTEENKELNRTPIAFNQWYINRELQEYEESSMILVPSLFVKETFKKYYTSKVHAITLSINLKNYYPINTIKKNDNFFDILFIGSVSIRKGLHYLIDAFHKFNHPNKRLHIIGSPTSDKNFFNNKLKHDKIFYYKNVSHLRLLEIINKSHIFVLPSLEDGFAIVVLEALACGCPVIVSENTGAADIVNKNKCGFTIPIRNSQAISDKLTLLSDNKNLLNEFSHNGLKLTKSLTWDDYVNRLNHLILEIKKNKI